MQRIILTLHMQEHMRLSGDTNQDVIRYLGSVLRYKTGDQLVLCDGNGTQGLATITDISRNSCRLQIADIQHVPSEPSLTLALPIIKPATLEEIIGTTTQLGVTRFVFFRADHSQGQHVHALQNAHKQQRLQAISREHAEQSERSYLPQWDWTIHTLSDILEMGTCIVGMERQQFTNPSLPHTTHPILIVGPEGGWSLQERTLIKEHALSVSLSGHILRVETAAICLVYEVAKSLQT